MNIKKNFVAEKIEIKKICVYVGAIAILGSAIGISIYDEKTNEDKSIIEETEQLSIILRSHSTEIAYVEQQIDNDGELKSVMVPVEVNNITTDNETSVPESYKEAIAFVPFFRSFKDDEGNKKYINELVPIYDKNDIPTTETIYMKTEITNNDGLIVYENIDITQILDYSGLCNDKTFNKTFTGFIEQENPIYGTVLIPEYETTIVKEEDTIEAKTYSKTR